MQIIVKMGKVNKLRQKAKNAGIKKPIRPIKTQEESEPSSDDESISNSDEDNYENIRNKPVIKFGVRTNSKPKTLANATDDIKVSLVNRRPINKREKLKSKHNNLLQKIKKADQEKKNLLAKVKRQKTVITGDMNPLKDALPSLDSLMKLKPDRDAIKTGIGSIDKMKQPTTASIHMMGGDGGIRTVSKKTKKEMKRHKIKKLAKEYKQKFHHFQQVLNHEDFMLNPREAVAEHIRLTMRNS